MTSRRKKRKAQAPPIALQCSRKELDSLVACLALGRLEAIRRRAKPTDDGYYLAIPAFVWPLKRLGVSKRIIDVLETCDEIYAMELLRPDRVDAMIEGLMKTLEREIRRVPEFGPETDWLLPPPPASPPAPPRRKQRSGKGSKSRGKRTR